MAICSVHSLGTSGSLGRSVLSAEKSFSRFIEFQLGDFAVGWVNWDLNLLSVLLISDDLLNVDAPSSSIDGEDLTSLALNTTFGGTDLNRNSISLSDWDRSAVIFASEFLAQVATHHLSSQAAWSGEMSFSRLSSLARNT